MTQYYVYLPSEGGDDGHDGLTPATAFATHQRALDVVQPGDSVNSGTGLFYENLYQVTNGTAAARIIFNAHPNGTIIDGSKPFSGSWTLATDSELVGTGTWSMSTPRPGAVVEGTTVLLLNQIHPYYMDGNYLDGSAGYGAATGFTLLAYPAGQWQPRAECYFWDGIDAEWGWRTLNGRAYVRYKNGDDPNTKNLRRMDQPALNTNGKSYHTWNNYTWQCGGNPTDANGNCSVYFNGWPSESRENIINGKVIRADHTGVIFYSQTRSNKVLNCLISGRLIGHMSWPVDRSTGYSANVAWNQYLFNKFAYGQTVEHDSGVTWIDDTREKRPTLDEVGSCEMTDSCHGLFFAFGGDQFWVHDCFIHGVTPQGFYFAGSSSDWAKGTNWRIEHCHFREQGIYQMRTNFGEFDIGQCYFTSNIVENRQNDGQALYIAGPYQWPTAGPCNFDIWIAHCSFQGGWPQVQHVGDINSTRLKYVNNIWSAGPDGFIHQCQDGNFENTQSMIPAWGYSAHIGSFNFRNPPAWWDEGNIWLSGAVWPFGAFRTDFSLPTSGPGAACRNTGVDVSQPFTVRGVQYGALPGFPTGYFSGSAPHMGAWQEPAGGPTSQKSTMTSPVNGSVFTGSSVTFTWTVGVNVSEYWLDVGTTFGGTQIYTESQGLALSKTVTGIPTTGIAIYVRLWSRIFGNWDLNDYNYTAFNAGSPPDPGWPVPAPGPPSAPGVRLVIITKTT